MFQKLPELRGRDNAVMSSGAKARQANIEPSTWEDNQLEHHIQIYNFKICWWYERLLPEGECRWESQVDWGDTAKSKTKIGLEIN